MEKVLSLFIILKGPMGRMARFLAILLFVPCSMSLNAQEFSKELKDKIVRYRIEREIIRKELISRVRDKSLKTREEKSQAIAIWKIKNSDRIAKQRRLAKEIRENLRQKIIKKYENLQGLPPEQSNQLLQNWYSQNSQYFSVVGGSKSLETAMNELKVKTTISEQTTEQTRQSKEPQVQTPETKKKVKAENKKIKKPKKVKKAKAKTKKKKDKEKKKKEKDKKKGKDTDKDKDKDKKKKKKKK